MDLMTSRDEWMHWRSLSGDDVNKPFESVVAEQFKYLVGAGFSTIFRLPTVEAYCNWSRLHGFMPIAMFFTIPGALEYYEEAGFYGGFIISGHDDPKDVERFVGQHGKGAVPMSIYDVSHRFIVLPEDQRWMLLADRDADVCLFGFRSAEDRQLFNSCGENVVTFDSLADTVDYAKSFMRYDMNLKDP